LKAISKFTTIPFLALAESICDPSQLQKFSPSFNVSAGMQFLLQEWAGILHSKALELDSDRQPQLA
jgi:hypothetical protein